MLNLKGIVMEVLFLFNDKLIYAQHFHFRYDIINRGRDRFYLIVVF